MDITTTLQDGVSVIGVCGSLDSTTAPRAQDEILPLVGSGCRLVLDLSRCDYVSSAGLRVLLMIAKQLAAKNGQWAIAGLSNEIQDVMEMTGFAGFFTTFGTVAEALAAVKKTCP